MQANVKKVYNFSAANMVMYASMGGVILSLRRESMQRAAGTFRMVPDPQTVKGGTDKQIQQKDISSASPFEIPFFVKGMYSIQYPPLGGGWIFAEQKDG